MNRECPTCRCDQRTKQDPLQAVTSRERQFLTRIASGHSNKAIARELKLSVKTVEKHRANLMRKLSLHNATDIRRFAMQHHLMGQDTSALLAATELAGNPA